MWIRSQNKDKLININNHFEIDYAECYGIWGDNALLGIYSTKEKALKVLDEIEEMINLQDEYKAQGEDRNDGTKRLIKFIYQMPQDINEVEEWNYMN